MNDQERKLAAEHLRASRERLLGLVSDLTAEQWGFHPAEGRWSIADCLEHVTRVENRVLGIIQTRTQDQPQQVAPEIREKDSFLLQIVPDRTERRQAPEIARPAGQWTDARELLAEFEKVRAATSKFAAETTADLRGYIHPHGAFGDLDCYQWLLLLGLHSERHARQIEEVKADPAFPPAAMSAPSA
jgi:uncharacterized damage-inducible protein DinB